MKAIRFAVKYIGQNLSPSHEQVPGAWVEVESKCSILVSTALSKFGFFEMCGYDIIAQVETETPMTMTKHVPLWAAGISNDLVPW